MADLPVLGADDAMVIQSTILGYSCEHAEEVQFRECGAYWLFVHTLLSSWAYSSYSSLLAVSVAIGLNLTNGV
jgi:hypothetical protein